MGLKRKLGVGLLSGALGLSLVGGGTWAYFNDVEEVSQSFKTGTLSIKPGGSIIAPVELPDLKPGDTFTKELDISNTGTLDIKNIMVNSRIVLKDRITGLELSDQSLLGHFKLTVKGQSIKLDQLKNYNGFDILLSKGLKTGNSVSIPYTLEFIENGQNQNQFQGKSVSINLELTANQENGRKVN